MLQKIWTDFIGLLVRRPARYQVAALCWRPGANGPEVLLVTSRETKRWVLPKGWPKKGLSGVETACEEAWEEAGVTFMDSQPAHVGRYLYHKRKFGDVPVRTLVDVYALPVDHLHPDFPEAGERTRAWFPAEEAATLVKEPQLARLLRSCPRQLKADIPPVPETIPC